MTPARADAAGEAEGALEFAIIRHGATPGNGERRYVGVLDQPLSDAGRAQAHAMAAHIATALPGVSRVYVSSLRRTCETAAILFPDAQQVEVEGIQEMDFGAFAGRSADEMADDPVYRAWVEGNCEGACLGGESKAQFTERVCANLERMLRGARARGERQVVLVAHGGTMMASFSRFADERRAYYEWLVGNCEGYRAQVAFDDAGMSFRGIETL